MTHTCTVRTATKGECGNPAVYTFSAGGTTFGECAEHYTPRSAVRADSRPTSTFKFRGNKFRYTGRFRYIAVRYYDGRVRVLKRSNNLATVKKVASDFPQFGGVIDTVTGQEA